MNKLIVTLAVSSFLLLSACNGNGNENSKEIHFSTSAEYPPFEYVVRGEITGFDVDLGNLVAKKLGKKAVFENMQFSSVLPALTLGQVEAAISTITITPERKKNIDFTEPYYFEAMALVYKQDKPIHGEGQLAGKKVACQLGSTMEIWLKKHLLQEQIMVMNNNNQAIEALKAGYVDAVLMDGAQGTIFSKKNPGLATSFIAKSEDGYAIAVKKGSPLLTEINQALLALHASGDIKNLEKKWLGEFK